MEAYEVVDFCLGERTKGDRIIFRSLKDMEQAYQDIDNGKDIYIKTQDGLITKLLNQMTNSKIYEGSIKLSAQPQDGEKVGEK